MVSCVLQVLQKVNWNLLEKQTENGNAMKKIQSIFPLLSFVVIVLLFAACSHEELGTPFYAGQEVSISAALSSSNNNDGKKRISGKDNVDKIDLTWDANDQILVTVGDKSSKFTLTSGAGTNNATFMGKMPADGSNFHVSYPIDYTDEVLTNQTYTANGFGKGLMKMSTKIPGTLDDGFMLSADNSLLGLELHGTANVSKIVLTNNDNQKAYTLDCSTQTVNTAEGTLFYIIVPAGVWAKGLKVEVYNGNGIVIEERTKTSAAEFIAGQALMMPEVEIKDVDDGLVTVTIEPTPSNARVLLFNSYHGHESVKRSLSVEKGRHVVYQVCNTQENFLSYGDTIHNVLCDTTVKITLEPFTEGNWERMDVSEYTRYDEYYLSRNGGRFVGPHTNWCYYVLPATPGETYRVCSNAGQLAAVWFAASTPPDYENKIPPTKVSCSMNGGMVNYIAEEFVFPYGAKYLIINASPRIVPILEHLIPDSP